MRSEKEIKDEINKILENYLDSEDDPDNKHRNKYSLRQVKIIRHVLNWVLGGEWKLKILSLPKNHGARLK